MSKGKDFVSKDEMDREQKKYFSDLKNKMENKYYQIYKFYYITCFGASASLYIFFKTNDELVQNDCLKKEIQNYIYSYLNDCEYFKKFNNNLLIEFDSDENVKKYYQGNYYLRLLWNNKDFLYLYFNLFCSVDVLELFYQEL